jgi:hypothetical protein
MATHLTLMPAYGRDYKSAHAAKMDLVAGKDFLIADFFHPQTGKPANLQQLRDEGSFTHARIRYAGLTRIVNVDISKNIE